VSHLYIIEEYIALNEAIFPPLNSHRAKSIQQKMLKNQLFKTDILFFKKNIEIFALNIFLEIAFVIIAIG